MTFPTSNNGSELGNISEYCEQNDARKGETVHREAIAGKAPAGSPGPSTEESGNSEFRVVGVFGSNVALYPAKDL